jgi:hypothetical protein
MVADVSLRRWFDRRTASVSGRLVRLAPLAGFLVLVLGSTVVAGCAGEAPAEWQEASDHRWRALRVRGRAEGGFEAVSPERTGLRTGNDLSESLALENRTLADGSGVALGDVDGDGRTDVYLSRIDGPNELHRNLGDWRFEEIGESAGVALADRASTGAAFADVDGDGDLDLLVTASGQANSLFLNDGAGLFRDASAEAGFDVARASRSLALADVDGDGDLDLYVTNNKTRVARDLFPPEDRTSERIVVQRAISYSVSSWRKRMSSISTRGVDGSGRSRSPAVASWMSQASRSPRRLESGGSRSVSTT